MATTSSINWESERKAFPVCLAKSYFCSSATTPLRREVLNAVQNFSQSISDYGDTDWDDCFEKIDSARTLLAKLLGGTSGDYAFGANTSHNMNILAQTLKDIAGKAGDIITLKGDFPSTVTPWRYHGFNIVEIPYAQTNKETIERIKSSLSKKTSAVVVSSVQFADGYSLDISVLGALLKEAEVPFILNATQSFSIAPINVEKNHITALTVSSHKWLGALYGSSILYIAKTFRDEIRWPMAGHLSYHDPEFSGDISRPKKTTSFIELGTPPFIILMSIAAALKEVERIGIGNISKKTMALTDFAYSLAKKQKIQLVAPRDDHSLSSDSVNSATIALSIKNPKALSESLAKSGICVTERRGALRISCHYFNTEEEVIRLFSKLI